MLFLCYLLSGAMLVFTYDHYDQPNYRAITRGEGAPDGSHMLVGRIQFNVTIDIEDEQITIPIEGTGFFAVHKARNGVEYLFFVTSAHLFDLNITGTPKDWYITPGRSADMSLLSKGTIEIFYGSVKLAEQKVFQVYPNNLYETDTSGEAHTVRVPTVYPFDDTTTDPNIDIATIELTDNQRQKFVADGGVYVRSTADTAETFFPTGAVCQVAGWGLTNENLEGPKEKPSRLQQANLIVKDMDDCKEGLDPSDPIHNNNNFACFSTYFRSESDPQIRGSDSGAPIMCGSEQGYLGSMVSTGNKFVVVGPKAASIFAFIKESFAD